MIAYIIHSALIWTVLLILYFTVFSRFTFFLFNRIYLLLALISGLIIPFIELPVSFASPGQVFSYILDPVFLGPGGEFIETGAAQTNDSQIVVSVLQIFYLFISIMLALRFVAGLLRIYRLYIKNEVQKQADHVRIVLERNVVPFSFMDLLFVSRNDLNGPNFGLIESHELVHIRQKHSFDLLFIEVLKIVFWFNPVVYFYKNAVTANHEFLADDNASINSKKSYSRLLIHTAGTPSYSWLTNNFNYSPIEKRIKMIYKNRSNPVFRTAYFSVLPLLIMFAILVSFTKSATSCNSPDKMPEIVLNDTIIPPPPPVPPPPPPPAPPAPPLPQSTALPTASSLQDISNVLTIADNMPRFPGCEHLSTKQEKEKCSEQKLMEFISANLRYPEEAIANKTEGRVFLRFVVKTDGKISDIEILRDIGSGCGEAAVKVIESMNELPERWVPGQQDGRPVNVYFTIPFVFALPE